MKRKVINLALQGGGAHGAFTWGVLDRLLEDEGIAIEGISATSAGAMNAAALKHGWVVGGTARAYQARIDGHDDPAAWDRLARRWTAQGNRYEEARARWRQAEASLEARPGRDGREPAREAIEAAAGIAAELDARPLLRAIEALARRARIPLSRSVRRRIDEAIEDAEPSTLLAATGIGGGPSGRADAAADAPGSDAPATASAVLVVPAPPTGRTADAFGLSRRERDVLALIAEGHTNREIGQRLFISQKTVGVHVGNILAKLDVSGRVEAATVAIRLGLVDLGPA